MLSDEQIKIVLKELEKAVESLPVGAVIMMSLDGGETMFCKNDMVNSFDIEKRNQMAASMTISIVDGILCPKID